MSFLDPRRFGSVDAARRTFLGVSGLGLSGAAVALLAGRDSLAVAAEAGGNPANDVAILNTALAAELEAIAAYGVGAGSGLLKGGVLTLATTFQGHHRQHADVLAGTVATLGGRRSLPGRTAFCGDAENTERCVRSPPDSGRTGERVSRRSSAVQDAETAKAAASILGDEAAHWAVLRPAVGEDPVPAAFVQAEKNLIAWRGTAVPAYTGHSSPHNIHRHRGHPTSRRDRYLLHS
jgi:hypothetical protein